MDRYHFNSATGKVERCTENVKNCPLGGYEIHFSSRDLAEKFYLNKSEVARKSIEDTESKEESEALLKDLIEKQDEAGLLAFVETRANSQLYIDALAERESYRRELDGLEIEYLQAKESVKSKSGDRSENSRSIIREVSLRHRDIYESLARNVSMLDEYRKLTARAAFTASQLREIREKEAGTFLTYDKDTIGDLISIGEYDSGSDAWHNVRSEGVGGSDVGAIMRVDGIYASANYRRSLLAKLGEDDGDEDPEARSDETTAIGRGNAWEEALRQRCQDENPDLNIAFCKTSWEGKDKSYRHANFDGIVLDDDGEAEGIVEIKTGSNPSKWGDPSLGLAGVPPSYRKQTLWYAANAKLKFGKIVALIDDRDYREYNFTMDDPGIQEEIAEIFESTDAFWLKVTQEKQAKLNGKGKATRKRARGFGKKVDYLRISEVLSAYTGWNLRTAQRSILSAVSEMEEKLGRHLDTKENQEVLSEVFSEHDPSTRKRRLVGIDLETTTASPRTGRIIETGIVEYSYGDSPKVVYGSLHSIPEKAMDGVGIGLTSVHGISEDMLEGKPNFDDPDEQEKILSILKKGVLVAHNAGFEDRFLSVNLKGYAEARDAGEIIILDTRTLARYLMLNSQDSSLRSFAEDNGVPYEGAHAASADALMMMKGLKNFQDTIYKKGKFYKKKASEASRRRALRDVAEANQIR